MTSAPPAANQKAPARTPKPVPALAPCSNAQASVLLQRKCSCGSGAGVSGECAECSGKKLRRKAYGTAAGVPASVGQVLSGPGQTLDAETRAWFEARLGHRFEDVRIHADARAAASARDVKALAYTVGKNVVFGENQYAPRSTAGRQLLAHELTHVVQQRGGTAGEGIGAVDAPEEREAEAAERRVTDGAGMSIEGGKPQTLRRKPAESLSSTQPVANCIAKRADIANAAMKRARGWLEYDVIPALEWYYRFLAGPRGKNNPDFRPDIREALRRHFHITDPKSVEAAQLLGNLKKMSEFLASASFRCDSQDSTGRTAYYDSSTKEVSLCEPFFEPKTEVARAQTIIHEISHAAATAVGDSQKRAADYAYRISRGYAALSPGEAVVNAESYGWFVYDVANKVSSVVRETRDTLSQCGAPFPSNAPALVQKALVLAERWNLKAWEATSVQGSGEVATVKALVKQSMRGTEIDLKYLNEQVYGKLLGEFAGNLKIECSTSCSEDSPGYVLNYGLVMGKTLHVCPSWFQSSPESQAAVLFVLLVRAHTSNDFESAEKFLAFARTAARLMLGKAES